MPAHQGEYVERNCKFSGNHTVILFVTNVRRIFVRKNNFCHEFRELNEFICRINKYYCVGVIYEISYKIHLRLN